MTAEVPEDGERGVGQQWRAMSDEWLQQEMLCHRHWTDEYVEHPETLLPIVFLLCLHLQYIDISKCLLC